MTIQRKVLLATGGVILASMMAVAGYSVSLDLAGKDWEPSPVQGAPQAEILQQLQKLPRPAELVGRVQDATDTSLSLSTTSGVRVVTMDNKTQVILLNGEPGVRSDLQRGMDVAIVGTFSDGGKVLLTEVVAILPPRR